MRASTDSSASESLDGALVTWNGAVSDFGVLVFERYDDIEQQAYYGVLWARDGLGAGTRACTWEKPTVTGDGYALHTIVIR